MMRVLALLALAAGLTGCGVEGSTESGWKDLPDGRQVMCVTTGYGVDCDWAHARKKSGVA